MIRGTTPVITFELPFETEGLAEVFLTFAQGGIVRINKTLHDCTASGNRLVLQLSQEDTLRLKSGTVTEIQIRARTHAGDAVASKIITEPTERILKDGVI